jgi:hypothetical protein
MQIVKLPSGAELGLCESDFDVSKALYQSFLSEMRTVGIEMSTEIDANFFKNIVCVALSSPHFEAALYACMGRCTYNKIKIVPKTTFQPRDARGDYFLVCYEVARENIMPFTQDLFAKFSVHWEQIKSFLASRSQTTPT